MVSLIYGGSGSGKSAFAEERVLALQTDKKYYIATMQVYGEEGRQKVLRHQMLRAGKGFATIECPRNLLQVEGDQSGTALLECMSNLVANEMFVDDAMIDETTVVESVIDGVRALSSRYLNLVIVSNNVFEDGKEYDASTMAYLRALGRVNQKLAELADEVYEVVVGIPVLQKGVKE